MFRLIGRMAYLSLAALISIAPAPMHAMNHNIDEEREEKVTSSTTINHRYQDEEISDSEEERQPAQSSAAKGKQKHRPRTNSLTDLHYQEEEELCGARSSHTYNNCSVFQNMAAAQRQQQQQSGLDQQNINDRLSFVKQPRTLPVSLVKSLLDEAPEDLKRVINTFKNHRLTHAALPKALILIGPSGVGKSDLGRAMAKEVGFEIEFINAAFLGDEYQKSSEHDLRSLIEPIVIREKPTFIVFDEMQALTAGHKNKEKGAQFNVAIAFWSLVDKYKNDTNVYFIGTINNEDDIPEQFKTRAPMIKVDLPSTQARTRILTHHMSELATSKIPKTEGKISHLFFDASCGAYLGTLAKKIGCFTGRDIVDLLQCAVQCATERSAIETPLTREPNIMHLAENAPTEEAAINILTGTDVITVKQEDLEKARLIRQPEVNKREYVGGVSYFWNSLKWTRDTTVSAAKWTAGTIFTVIGLGLAKRGLDQHEEDQKQQKEQFAFAKEQFEWQKKTHKEQTNLQKLQALEQKRTQMDQTILGLDTQVEQACMQNHLAPYAPGSNYSAARDHIGTLHGMSDHLRASREKELKDFETRLNEATPSELNTLTEKLLRDTDQLLKHTK